MSELEFTLTKQFLYQKCVKRVDKKRVELNKPQIDLCRNDKSLVSNFFNCNPSSNNKYLITKRLINYETDEIFYENGKKIRKKSGIKTGAVPAFNFKDEHEVLWGDEDEFYENLYSIFSLLITDIIHSKHESKEIIDYTLCDNVIYAKYSSFYKIKKEYDISLLHNFGIYDFMVNDQNMNSYIKIALADLYNKPFFEPKFRSIFLSFTQKFNDYTHLDKRILKHFIPELILLFKEYRPSNDSLGIRVKTLIEKDIIKAYEQISTINCYPEYQFSAEYEINKKILHASSTYICQLEEIAKLVEVCGINSYN